MKQCGKSDITWLTAMMLDAEIFGGCSEDGMEKKRMVKYVTALVSRPDIVVLAPLPGKMIHSFVQKTGVMWDIHAAIKRGCPATGRERVQITRDCCIWMIKNKGARKFTAHVPEGNRTAGIYAVACGLERVGVLTSAMVKDGRLIDMTIYQSKDSEVQSIIGGM